MSDLQSREQMLNGLRSSTATDRLVERLRLACDKANHAYRHDRDRLLVRAADRIEAQAARIAELEGALEGIFAELDERRGGPGHCHTVPGIWDKTTRRSRSLRKAGGAIVRGGEY